MAEPLARITRRADQAMIVIRGDLAVIGPAVETATGLSLPAATRRIIAGDRTVVWMAPDELLVMLPPDDLAQVLAALDGALADHHALVADVSDMRAVFDIEGGAADQVLAKLSPTDFATLPRDGARRTRAAQVAVAYWPTGTGFRLVGFRSVADYLALLLQNAALPGSHLDPR